MDLILHWNPDPEIVRLFGSFSLRYYSLLFVTGLILGYQIVKYFYKKEGLSLEQLDKLAMWVFVATVLGARLGHCLFYEPEYYLKHPIEMLLPIQITDGNVSFTGYQGLASHGGILAVFIAIVWFCRKTKTPVFSVLDKISVGGALTGAFIRLGNFFNSEIIGKATKANYGVVFERVDQVVRHPAQLYESVAYFMIFLLLFILYRNQNLKRQHGFIFGLFFTLLFVSRFIIEFFKINQVNFEDNLTFNMGQLLSVPFILMGLYIMYAKRHLQT
jgi:prolipoprotein diacylglyceryl transferase